MKRRPTSGAPAAGPVRVLREAVCTLLLASMSSACAAWTPRSIDVDPGDKVEMPGIVRLTLRDSTQLELRDVSVRPDSVIGFVRSYGHSTRVGVVTSSVASIQQRDVSSGRTLLMAMALGAVAVGVVAAVMSAGMGPGY